MTSSALGSDAAGTHQLFVYEHLVLVKWKLPTARAALEVVETVQRTRAAKRRGVVLMVLITDVSGVPDGPTRSTFAQHFPGVIAMCTSLAAIVEGSDLRAHTMRTPMRAITVVARVPAQPRIFSTLAEAFAELPPELLAQRDHILKTFRAQGLER